MPIYDYECSSCGKVRERYASINAKYLRCPECGGNSKRIITAAGHFCSNEDAGWLRSVREVVGTETREGREFHKDPTRSNYKAWMKKKGLRPMETGERTRPDPVDTRPLEKKVLERHIKRNRIEVRR